MFLGVAFWSVGRFRPSRPNATQPKLIMRGSIGGMAEVWKPGGMAGPAVVVRVAAAAGDLDGIGKIDPSFSTDRIYRVSRGELGFWLEEERVSPPVRQTYSRPSPELSDRLLVASIGGEIAGSAELRFDAWS
jgi:hypothetical protein